MMETSQLHWRPHRSQIRDVSSVYRNKQSDSCRGGDASLRLPEHRPAAREPQTNTTHQEVHVGVALHLTSHQSPAHGCRKVLLWLFLMIVKVCDFLQDNKKILNLNI